MKREFRAKTYVYRVPVGMSCPCCDRNLVMTGSYKITGNNYLDPSMWCACGYDGPGWTEEGKRTRLFIKFKGNHERTLFFRPPNTENGNNPLGLR